MKKPYSLVLALGIIILFFIQTAGTLVESIYILDLMNTTLDEKVLGILFLFTPLLFLPFYGKYPRGLLWLSFAVLLVARGILPYLNTSGRLLASGVGAAMSLNLLFLLLTAKPGGATRNQIGLCGSAGLGLTVMLSVLLRSLGDGLDYSLIPQGGWVAGALGLLLGWALTQLAFADQVTSAENRHASVTPALLGVFIILTLVWFAFSAPAVISRWTEGNYTFINITISLLAAGWVFLSLTRPKFLEQISPRGLLLWNMLFTVSLTATILSHRVLFPPTSDSAPVVVSTPSWIAQIILAVMLLLFPVIFFDMRIFLEQIHQATPTARALVPGILLGTGTMLLLIFAHIFTNVWGYVEPVSPFFRGKFYLPYLLLSASLTLLIWRAKEPEFLADQAPVKSLNWGWTLLLAAIFAGTLFAALPARRAQVNATERTSLVVMTFNTQQSNNDLGEKSFDEQLALMRRVSPDILALQESDSTRISLNNNDYVRYFAERLGYYSYYGPTTGTGTYGTAILSKYPLLNTRTVFTYSDQDEIGIAEAEVEVNGRRITIYDVHPDGSDTAMLAFAKTLLARSKDKPYVIALGDYNLRDHEEPYQLIDSVYTNAWVSVYPTEISTDGTDMSGENRIDHIFVSPSLQIRNPVYVLPPESATDHPVHWAEVYWENP